MGFFRNPFQSLGFTSQAKKKKDIGKAHSKGKQGSGRNAWKVATHSLRRSGKYGLELQERFTAKGLWTKKGRKKAGLG